MLLEATDIWYEVVPHASVHRSTSVLAGNTILSTYLHKETLRNYRREIVLARTV